MAALDIERTFATRAMKITSELDSNYVTGHNLGIKALYEIATMLADETKRLDYELELKNAQANREHIQADLGVLEAKQQNLLQQNRQLLDVQPSIKSINNLLDQFAVLQNRLDITTLFDDGDLLWH